MTGGEGPGIKKQRTKNQEPNLKNQEASQEPKKIQTGNWVRVCDLSFEIYLDLGIWFLS